jgi:DNA repair protein RadA/Sms
MAKEKSIFLCNDCGYESPKWAGKCPACGAWNSFVEKVVRSTSGVRAASAVQGERLQTQPVLIDSVATDALPRIDMRDGELNRVLGGGLVPGSLVLLGGEPGIGKSTLVLQTILGMPERKVLYVSGEESVQQIKLRADRIPHNSGNCHIVCETSLETIFTHIKNVKPELLVVDSIQTMCSEAVDSSPGSMAQVRECTGMLLKFAKENNVPVILIGHITKDGAIAGPKILEHIVDVVIQFEGDQHYLYRVLRSIKNRFPYLDPLNHLQIELMRRYRQQREGDPVNERVQRGIHISINGIAAGLRNTG